jgi:hypothetical protein
MTVPDTHRRGVAASSKHVNRARALVASSYWVRVAALLLPVRAPRPRRLPPQLHTHTGVLLECVRPRAAVLGGNDQPRPHLGL